MKRDSEYVGSNIPWKEREKIRHEINTYYQRYQGLHVIAHPSVGLDNKYYIYYAENYGYDDFNIYLRVPNMG